MCLDFKTDINAVKTQSAFPPIFVFITGRKLPAPKIEMNNF